MYTYISAGVYNLKKSYEHLYIPLASRPFGMFSWMWSVFIVQYDDIAEQCGMDAVTTIRLFEFGVKISLVAVLNSVYLFPIYKYLGNVVVDDNAKEFSLSNLPTSHPGLIATTIAAYIFFLAAMHFIDKVRAYFVCAWMCGTECASKCRAASVSWGVGGPLKFAAFCMICEHVYSCQLSDP